VVFTGFLKAPMNITETSRCVKKNCAATDTKEKAPFGTGLSLFWFIMP
jgi:hypothetical protein